MIQRGAAPASLSCSALRFEKKHQAWPPANCIAIIPSRLASLISSESLTTTRPSSSLKSPRESLRRRSRGDHRRPAHVGDRPRTVELTSRETTRRRSTHRGRLRAGEACEERTAASQLTSGWETHLPLPTMSGGDHAPPSTHPRRTREPSMRRGRTSVGRRLPPTRMLRERPRAALRHRRRARFAAGHAPRLQPRAQ
jgi:hypothetical protein